MSTVAVSAGIDWLRLGRATVIRWHPSVLFGAQRSLKGRGGAGRRLLHCVGEAAVADSKWNWAMQPNWILVWKRTGTIRGSCRGVPCRAAPRRAEASPACLYLHPLFLPPFPLFPGSSASWARRRNQNQQLPGIPGSVRPRFP